MNRPVKITLLSFFAGLLILGMVLFVVTHLEQPFFSPPDEPRSWARTGYRELFHPSGTAVFPALSTTPPPDYSVSREEGKIEIETGPSGQPDTTSWNEIFLADENNEVALPTGNRLRLAGVAIVMPEDIEDADESGAAMVDLTWLNPLTLDPLPKEVVEDWEIRKWVQGNHPELFLRVSNEGEAPIRWLAGSACDDRTLMKVQGGSSFHSHTRDAQVSLDLLIWHQTALRVAVNFSFGEPERRELEMRKGEEARFGDDGLVRVLEVVPGRFGSRSWQSTGSGSSTRQLATYRYEVGDLADRNRKNRRSAVFHLWPPHNEKLIDLEIEERRGDAASTDSVSIWGNDGLSSVEIPAEANLVSATARRFPRLGRAVFVLPRIPRLPETDNLFATPIKRVELRYANDMKEMITDGAAVRWSGGSTGIPRGSFPIVLEDTTPAEVLSLYQDFSGQRLYFDRRNLEISNTKTGVFVDLKKWWERNKPRWAP